MSQTKPSVDKKRKWIAYGVAAAVGLAIALAVAVYRGFGLGQPGHVNAGAVSDGCFVAGVLIFGVGCLMWIGTTGFFDMLSYGMRSFFNLILPHKRPENEPKFYDYKMEKEKRRGKPTYTLVIVGAALLLISGLCTALFFSLSPT